MTTAPTTTTPITTCGNNYNTGNDCADHDYIGDWDDTTTKPATTANRRPL